MKNRKFYSFISLMIVIPSLLSGCKNGEASITINDLNVPAYSSNKKINIGAWSWTVNGVSENQFSNLKDAGVNLLIGTFSRDESTNARIIDRAAQYDIGIILDKRPWNLEIPDYGDEDSFLGYCTFDEPKMSDLPELAAMKNSWDESDLANKLFFVNLNPSYSSSIGATYEEYVRAYVEDCGLDMVAFDYYPLYKDPEDQENVLIRDDWLYGFDICAHYASMYDLPLWYTLLTTQHSASSVKYINPTAKDLEYQMYVAMTFGSTYLIHYTYAATGPDHINPIVDRKGEPTDSYYDVKESSEKIRKWDNFFMEFKWLGITGVFGNRGGNTGLIDYLTHSVPANEFGTLDTIKANEDVIVGHFKDKNDNKGYMITNLTNPYHEKNAIVTLTFDSEYKGVKVYKNGTEEVLTLNGNKLELSIESGDAAFIIPLKVK